MNLILRQVIGYQQGLKKASASPLLKKQLENTQQQLNQILNKWKFGEAPLTSAEEFLNKFAPWVEEKINLSKELKVFLAKKGVSNLKDLADLPESESEQLTFYKDNIKLKEQIIDDYKNQEQTWHNTEQDYLRRIDELQKNQETSEEVEILKQELARKETEWELTEADYLTQIANHDQELQAKIQEFQTSNGELLKRIEELSKGELSADYDDLITERDEVIREKKTLEQSVLALNNRLTLKQQEVNNKEKALEKLKKEASEKEISLNKKLTEKNGLITTLNFEIKQHKEKYSKQGQLLDTEQLEGKKLEEENENLKAEIAKLKGAK
jgi:hypothetical protein